MCDCITLSLHLFPLVSCLTCYTAGVSVRCKSLTRRLSDQLCHHLGEGHCLPQHLWSGCLCVGFVWLQHPLSGSIIYSIHFIYSVSPFGQFQFKLYLTVFIFVNKGICLRKMWSLSGRLTWSSPPIKLNWAVQRYVSDFFFKIYWKVY